MESNQNKAFVTTYWNLGSNIDPEQHIEFAVRKFQQEFNDIETSKLYQSTAVGFQGNDFLNLALAVKTNRPLQDLLEYADNLEQAAGRVRVSRGSFDSRTLDVDLLMYGDLKGKHCGKRWPAQDIEKEAHVLKPMVDIAATVRHPVSGRRFQSIWREYNQENVSLIEVERGR